jgi:hypothetical protein
VDFILIVIGMSITCNKKPQGATFSDLSFPEIALSRGFLTYDFKIF